MSDSSSSRFLTPLAQRLAPLKSAVVSGAWSRPLRYAAWAAAGVALLSLIVLEARSSWFQARIFASIATRATWTVERGPSSRIVFPHPGPYDERLGYSRIPEFTAKVREQGFSISSQARISPSAALIHRLGAYPIYHEKQQAGLRMTDRNGNLLLDLRYPERTYRDFSDVPPLVVQMLLYIENRTLLDSRYPNRNPAVEWPRLMHAVFGYGLQGLHSGGERMGASTLATQLEKMRHSPRGRTHSPGEKLGQMFSASLRACQDGPRTAEAQRRIVRDYLNSLPLAAAPAIGEVIGLGDGLWAWYGADFSEVNDLLRASAESLSPTGRRRQAFGLRQVLSLLISARSPARYLTADSRDLSAETDRYLRVLSKEGILPQDLANLALQQHLTIQPPRPGTENDFVAKKGNDAIRADLFPLLGVDSSYALNRMDLLVDTTLDNDAQKGATALLATLTSAGNQRTAVLRQPHLLAASDPTSVIYSFTLFERDAGFNLLRVQTDTLNQPLNINEGTRLELGSTAKLRTLIQYLQIIEQIHTQYAPQEPARLSGSSDPLTLWGVEYLSKAPDRRLTPMLEAALDRRYSASPGEAFFTAGGLHTFSNFDRSDNRRILTVREAFERSVNLVFIRLVRDIERYYLARASAPPGEISYERRRQYIIRFADQEGIVYLTRFYRKYQGHTADEVLDLMGNANATSPRRLAVIYRSVRPAGSVAEFWAYLHQYARPGLIAETVAEDLYEKFAPGKFSLQDRGYLAHIHPLELWLLCYKEQHPKATLRDAIAASAPERQESYAWLFRTRYRGAQDLRIRILQEQDVFQRISREWRRLGYPFEDLVPSYATAIGVSGDTPAALAELMGIIAAGGIRYRTASIRQLRFAENTPVATVLRRSSTDGNRVLSPEISAVVHRELVAVVEKGTARRAAGGLTLSDGTVLPIGGKTGTGDNRVRIYAGRGQMIESRVASRTAVFAFLIGDRYYGTVMAFVPGKKAGNYEFTSALAVQVFKELEPVLKPMLK